jgi:uncharacterized membrane protein YfhO
VRWVPCAEYAQDGEEAWELVNNKNTDLDHKVIIESDDKTPPSQCETSLDLAQVTVIDEEPNQIKMSVRAPGTGWLVLSDLWYPGWKAEMDGQGTPVFRANYLFRAVWVPVGEHTIVWKYSPGSLWIGLLVSSVSWIFVGSVLLFYSVRLWKNR